MFMEESWSADAELEGGFYLYLPAVGGQCSSQQRATFWGIPETQLSVLHSLFKTSWQPMQDEWVLICVLSIFKHKHENHWKGCVLYTDRICHDLCWHYFNDTL